ncbi:hypothetical protein KAT24_02045 [Candidatus Pacearchaeota archaeon]|nr:hypothetical protein [Candidatus Pacearchaeota archaeon]
MPNQEVHCEISRIRTKGNSYQELHAWMDEASKYIGSNHRLERHFYTEEYKDYITERWGAKAVVEWLFHIAIDNLETANKFAINEYKASFEEIIVKFDGKKISQCNFVKTTSNGNKKVLKVSVNEKEKINELVKKEEKPKKKFYPYKRRFR